MKATEANIRTYATLDFAEQWGRLNDTIIGLVDYVPDDKLDWSPREDLWGFRTILSHISSTRQNWLTADGADREEALAEAAVVAREHPNTVFGQWSALMASASQ